MKAQDLQFTQLLEGSKQFIVPIFQRTYSWEKRHCQQLWDDIVRVGKHSDLNSHFIGSAVYIPSEDTSAAISQWLVIDGQQRITTMMLLLLAFKRRLELEEAEEPVGPDLIEDYYLKNRYGKGELKYKMLLTRTDKDTLIALIDGKEPDDAHSKRIVDNYRFFSDKISSADLGVVYQGIQKLMIVDVRLQQGIDNPQMIFESMNSTGKALTQADLIRNFVLMGLGHNLQARLYTDYWRPMEVEFGAENYVRHFDEFVRFYLVINARNPKIRRDEVYDEFKVYSREHDVEDLLASLKEFASFYCRIALVAEPDRVLGEAFHDIRELRSDVCYPFLMEVYEDYSRDAITKEEFVEIVRLVESYVFRRAVCEIPTNSLRQTFATLTRDLDKTRYVESAKAAFLHLPSYRRFPGDDEFMRQLEVRNLYKFNRRSYWLRRFENFGRKERVPVQDYTIEHIMPQNEALSEEWRRELGDDWEEIHGSYLHTLGNLTLTGYNSEYSDRPFAQKRDMLGGFAQSPLVLNAGLGKCDIWNESAIKSRAKRLSKIAVKIWEYPQLPDGVLEQYIGKTPRKTQYTLDHHPHLNDGISRQLFDAFRTEVLALDECVSDEIRKHYIAFKAETNFVHVVPQSKRLRLGINLDFPEVDDPRGQCRDMTNVGSLSGRNVRFFLSKMEDLPYAVGIVRQALEKQLGEEV